MSRPAGVQRYDPQEFSDSEDMDDSHGEQRSLSFEESDMLISPPRSQSRLGFFYQDDQNQPEWDPDVTAVPISRVRLPHSLSRGRATNSRDHDDDDDDDYHPPSGLSILHYENSPMCFEYQPISPLQPGSVHHAALPQDQTVNIPSVASHIQTGRLDYPYHGFSRSALLLHKSFWTTRHKDWLAWQANEVRRRIDRGTYSHNPGNAYTGTVADTQEVSGPPSRSRVLIPPSNLDRSFEEQASRGYAEDFNAPIYPRVGDISTLHDPRSEHMDRCFFKFPLWTIQKTLYLFDMVYRASLTPRRMRSSASSRSLQLYSTGSTTSGSEDMTLVTNLFEKITLEDGGLPPRNAPTSSPPRKTAYNWEVGWYDRWEILADLIQQGTGMEQVIPPSPSTTFLQSMDHDSPLPGELPETPIHEGPIFHFASDDSDSGDEDDEEEEDDIGTLVINSTNWGLRRGPRLPTV